MTRSQRIIEDIHWFKGGAGRWRGAGRCDASRRVKKVFIRWRESIDDRRREFRFARAPIGMKVMVEIDRRWCRRFDCWRATSIEDVLNCGVIGRGAMSFTVQTARRKKRRVILLLAKLSRSAHTHSASSIASFCLFPYDLKKPSSAWELRQAEKGTDQIAGRAFGLSKKDWKYLHAPSIHRWRRERTWEEPDCHSRRVCRCSQWEGWSSTVEVSARVSWSCSSSDLHRRYPNTPVRTMSVE